MSVDTLMVEIGKLDIEDRFEIVRRIQDSAEADLGLSAEQEAELERRMAAWDADPGKGYTLEEVIAHARGNR